MSVAVRRRERPHRHDGTTRARGHCRGLALCCSLALALALPLLPTRAAAQGVSSADSADHYYAAGLAYLRKGEAKIPSPWGVLDALTLYQDLLRLFGKDNIARARDAFRRALAFRPDHGGAAAELAKLALSSGEPDELRVALELVGGAVASEQAPPEVLLWQSRLAAALGDTAAVAAAERYASRGGDASLARLARARALFSTGRDSAGADAYFAGLEALTHDGAVAYYADLTPLLHEAERKEWQTATTAERSDWLRRFWARRSAGAGVSPGERVAEHYARLAIASERYRRTSERTASIADARAVQHGLHGFGLDDRGVMYVLHGKPDSVVRTRGPGVLPNETWVYRQPVGQNRLVHFVALRRAAEYVLVADPLLALAGPSDASASICDPLDCGLPDAVLELLEDRAPFDPRYGLLAGRFRGRVLAGRSERTSDAAAAAAQDFASASLAVAGEVQAATDEALRRDSFRPTLGEPIPFYYDVYAFRGEAGRTDLLLAAAVPGERLEPQPGDAGLLYPIEVRFLVVDSAAAQTFDTSLARLYQSSKPLGPGQHLRTILALSLPAGSYQHTVVLKNPRAERAGGAYGGSLTVPDFRGDSLMISDLVLGESSGRGLRRGEVDVAPVPPRQFPSGAAVGLFYEVYNLPPGVLYRTRIRVEPLRGKSVFARLKGLFGGETAPLALAFDESAAPESSGVQRVFRRVELGNLKPGPYRLSVETRVGEDTTRRSTEFVIQ